MDDRDDLQQSFDPRTWTQGAAEPGRAAPARGRSGGAVRPPFILAGATAVGILGLGAAAAFMARPDMPANSEIAAQPASVALEDTGSGGQP